MARTSPRGVEVWTVRRDDVDAARLHRYLDWLTPDEIAKHGRIAGDVQRDEYLLTRALSRWVLSRYEPSVAPPDWRFGTTEAGRPFALDRETPSFNLSHADGLVVCAVSTDRVGIDVEPIAKGEDFLASAKRCYSAHENDDLDACLPSERPGRAVELWTLKEAYLKARGDGISVHLDRFSLRRSREGAKRWTLSDVAILGDDPAAWQLEVQAIDETHLVAVAVERGQRQDVDLVWTSIVIPV